MKGGALLIDRATVFGLAATLVLLVWVLVAGAGWDVDVFWRTPSLALVVGGALLTTLMAFPGGRFRSLRSLGDDAPVNKRSVDPGGESRAIYQQLIC